MKTIIKYLLATAACAAVLASCQKKEVIVGTNDSEGFFLSRTTLALIKGNSESLTATVTPKGAGTVSWSSADPSVASVENGLVTAVGSGETTITATSGSRSLTCAVSVTSPVTVVTLSDHDVDFDKGDTYQLSYVLGPDDINVPVEVEWASSDESILSVTEDGLVTALRGGTAIITVNANGVTDACTFFSHCYPTGLEVTPTSGTVNVNRTLQFSARLLPDDVTETLDFEWVVEDPTLASVDETGLVKGLAAGETTLTVTAGEFTASMPLTVIREIITTTVSPNANNWTNGVISFVFSSNAYYYNGTYGMYIPNNATFTISVPEGYQIDRITFTPTYNGSRDLSVNTGTYSRSGSNHTWVPSGTTSSVTFTKSSTNAVYIRDFTITYQ